MNAMTKPWKHPQSGILYFRREVPVDIRKIIGHAAPNVGAAYGSNPLRRMAREREKFPSIASAAGLLCDLAFAWCPVLSETRGDSLHPASHRR